MYTISTITMNTRLPYNGKIELNLYNIWKYLEFDKVIKGMKYNGSIKGYYNVKSKSNSNNVSFYNQVNLIIYYNQHYINVKLFKNGSLHFTGCKLPSEGEQVTKIISDTLIKLSLKENTVILVRDPNGVLIDSDNNIYSIKYKRIVGHVTDNSYYIGRKEYVIDSKYNRYFKCKKSEQNKINRLLDFNGDDIGYTRIKLINNKKKLYNNNNIIYDYQNCIVMYKDIILGFIEYNFTFDEKEKETEKEIYEIDVKCTPFIQLDGDSVNCDVNINSINICFDIGFKIDRSILYNILLNSKYICKYNPESYCGINMTYKNNSKGDGFCTCLNKCTCNNITFLIFHSGKVISTGYTHLDDIEKIYNNFIKLCNDNSEMIKISSS